MRAGVVLVLALLAACGADRLPPSPRDRADAEQARAAARVTALVRGLPGVLDVRVLVVLPVDDPLAPDASRQPAMATVMAVSDLADPSPIRNAATSGARALLGANAAVVVEVVPTARARRRDRRVPLAVGALAVAAAAAALALALARRRALAGYRGIKPQ